MSILALDLGLKTGWAMYDDDNVLSSGMEKLSVKKGTARCVSIIKYTRWLRTIISNNDISEIYYEEIMRHLGTRAAHLYGAFEAVTEILCYDNNIELTGVPVGTIKLFGCGRGNGSKQDMIDAAQLLDVAITDDNQADAFHLLRYAMRNRYNRGAENA